MASKPTSAVIASRISEAVEQTALINDMIRALQAKSQALMDECWEFTREAAPTEDLARTLFDSVRAIEEHRTQDDVSEEARSRFRDLLAGDPVLKECLRAGNVSPAPGAPAAAQSGAAQSERPADPAKASSHEGAGAVAAQGERKAARRASPSPSPEAAVPKPASRLAAVAPVPPPAKPVEPAITADDVDLVRRAEHRGYDVEDSVFDEFVRKGRRDVFDVAGISPYLAKAGGAVFVFEIAVYSFRNGSPDPFEDSGGVKKWRKKLSSVVYERLSKLIGVQDAGAVPVASREPAPETGPEDRERHEAPARNVAEEPSQAAEAVADRVDPPPAPPSPPASPPSGTARGAQTMAPPVRRPAPPRPAMRVPQPENRGGTPTAVAGDAAPTNVDTPKAASPVQTVAEADQPERVVAPPVRRGPIFGGAPVSRDVRTQPTSPPRARDPVEDDASFGDEEGLPGGEAVPIELIAAQAASQSGRPRPAARGKPPPDPFD